METPSFSSLFQHTHTYIYIWSRVPCSHPPPMGWGGVWCPCGGVYTYIHTYIPTYLPTYLRTYIHTITLPYITLHSIHTYIPLHYLTLHYLTLHYLTLHSIHTYIHTQTHTHTYIHRHTHIHTYIYTYIHTQTQTHTHTYIHTYIHTYQHTNIPTYQHTSIPTYQHTTTTGHRGGGTRRTIPPPQATGGGTRRTIPPPQATGGGDQKNQTILSTHTHWWGGEGGWPTLHHIYIYIDMVFRAENIYRSLIIIRNLDLKSRCSELWWLAHLYNNTSGQPIRNLGLSRVFLAETKPESENDSVDF